jgi:hypothetical protein
VKKRVFWHYVEEGQQALNPLGLKLLHTTMMKFLILC